MTSSLLHRENEAFQNVHAVNVNYVCSSFDFEAHVSPFLGIVLAVNRFQRRFNTKTPHSERSLGTHLDRTIQNDRCLPLSKNCEQKVE